MINTVSIENARIGFRNFSGLGGQYNREGDRNFVIFLDHDIAESLASEGWLVKELPAREEGDRPQPFIKVSVGFKFPPKIVLVKKNRVEYLEEKTINLLDWAEIESCDITIRPYEWEVSGKTGVKAYLKTMYVKLIEDDFESKYADLIDSAKTCIGPNCPIIEE